VWTSTKLTQTQDVGGTATIQHDAAGNITSDGINTYTYSDRGRMATMTNAGGTVTYSYNALEMRVGKTGPTALVPTGAAYYVYDESGKLLGEYDANGVPLYETIYLGVPVGVIKQTGTAGASNIAISLYNVSTDQVGAPRIITRQSDEAIVWRWDSAEAFGATAPDQNPSSLGAFSFNQRFPGQVFDAESGLVQNWNREYNPRIGRYMQSDPIGLAGGINTFAYVGGDPLRSSDPTGLIFPVVVYGIGAWALANAPWLVPTTVGVVEVAAMWKAGAISPSSAGLGAVSALRPTAQAARTLMSSSAAEMCVVANEVKYLYRGVSAGHPALDLARQGRVVPGNLKGTVSAEAHNLGGQAANSSFTSWTRDQAIAATHAGKNGPGGVVLRVPEGAPPAGAKWSWEWSPDVWGEAEVLMRGIRNGVEVLK